jgi:hypothetical protein
MHLFSVPFLLLKETLSLNVNSGQHRPERGENWPGPCTEALFLPLSNRGEAL